MQQKKLGQLCQYSAQPTRWMTGRTVFSPLYSILINSVSHPASQSVPELQSNTYIHPEPFRILQLYPTNSHIFLSQTQLYLLTFNLLYKKSPQVYQSQLYINIFNHTYRLLCDRRLKNIFFHSRTTIATPNSHHIFFKMTIHSAKLQTA